MIDPPVDDLLTHLRKHYTDRAIQNDLDSVLACADDEAARRAVLLYAQLRRNADGFKPKVDGHNNHDRIGAPALALLSPNRSVTTARTCPGCGKSFIASRSAKKTCSGRCRKRVSRSGAVTPSSRSQANTYRGDQRGSTRALVGLSPIPGASVPS